MWNFGSFLGVGGGLMGNEVLYADFGIPGGGGQRAQDLLEEERKAQES